MFKKIFLFTTLISILLILSCNTGQEATKILTEIDWDQTYYTASTGGKLYYDVTVENKDWLPIGGTITVEILFYDFTTTRENVNFSYIPGGSSSTEYESKNVAEKKVIDVTIKDEDFVYK